MNEGKSKGITTELLCEAYISSLGYNVSIPIGEDCKYDFIADIKGKLIRVQVKTCKENENGISISTKSITTSGKENVIHLYSKEEIDFFATFYNHKCYLIPIEECEGNRTKSLSFSGKRVNEQIPLFIDNFTAETIIEKIKNNETFKKTENTFKVFQYDLKGNLINSFSSYAEAGKYIGKSSSHISSCARGKRKTAYGYKWSINS